MYSKIVIRFLFVTFFITNTPVDAQMYVSPNTYIFASDRVVYITKDLELNSSTSTFYLRSDAQLWQGTLGTGVNKGQGDLSVFQEGTVNNYAYNYWCSPVGSTISSSVNNPFSITQLKDIQTLTTSTVPTILSYSNYNGTANPLAIAPYWIWKYIKNNEFADWQYVGSTATINSGEGFTMKGTSGTNSITVNGIQNNPGSAQRYDFRGKPNDGTISIPVSKGNYTLTGNPYPSTIDLSLFLAGATNSTGIAYFWEQDKTVNSHYIADYKGGYGSYSPVSLNGSGIYVPATFYSYDGSGNQVTAVSSPGTNYERRFSPIGQGFMIMGNGLGSSVEMKNSYRVYVKEGATNKSQFERSSSSGKKKNSRFLSAIPSISGFDYTKVSTEALPQIRFNTLLNNQAVSQMVLAFVPEATDGMDHAMDAVSPNDGAPASVYFIVEDKKYIIDAMGFNIDKKIPIGFSNASQANFKITVKEVTNLTEVENIFLHDKVSDSYHDIKNSFYDLSLPAGINNSQYEITFKDANMGIKETIIQSFEIYQNNDTKNTIINNPLLVELESFGLYDVAGKLIFNKTQLGINTNYKFSTSNLSRGIYIVKLITKDKIEVGKKIIVN